MGIFGIHFQRNVDLVVLYVSYVQIIEFIWLPGQQKGLILEQMLKSLLKNHKVDQADTFHALL